MHAILFDYPVPNNVKHQQFTLASIRTMFFFVKSAILISERNVGSVGCNDAQCAVNVFSFELFEESRRTYELRLL